MHLSIIVVHYHTPDLLEDAVGALRTDLTAHGQTGELVVVDNGSTPRERSQIERLGVRTLRSGTNRGYAGGINQGVAETTGEFVVAMNPDVVVRPGCLSALVAALTGGAAAAGPRLYWDPGCRFLLPPTQRRTRLSELLTLVSGRGDRLAAFCRRRWRRHARRFWQARRPFSTVSLSGALLAMRRDALDRVGAFDDGFQLYFEEDDWLRRLSRYGLSAHFVPAAEAVHLYNQSAAAEPRAREWLQESAIRFRRRHYGPWFHGLARAVSSSSRGLSLPRMLPPGRPSFALPSPCKPELEPSWLEISPHPTGFPAGAARLTGAPGESWLFPEEIWARLAPGRYFMTLCGAGGVERARFGFDRLDEAAA